MIGVTGYFPVGSGTVGVGEGWFGYHGVGERLLGVEADEHPEGDTGRYGEIWGGRLLGVQAVALARTGAASAPTDGIVQRVESTA